MLYLAKPVLVIAMALGAALFVGRSFVETTLETSSGRYRGSVNASVTLVEYGDYQCPPCASYNVTIKDMVARYGDKVRLEYRHFPLLPVHPNATPAALAAEAAGEQGQYWKMNDLLFESQQRWARAADPEKEFVAMAAELGLDRDRFLKAFKSAELQERVSKDAAAGRALGVAATPTFFLNGRRIQEAPRTVEEFMKLVDAELQRPRN